MMNRFFFHHDLFHLCEMISRLIFPPLIRLPAYFSCEILISSTRNIKRIHESGRQCKPKKGKNQKIIKLFPSTTLCILPKLPNFPIFPKLPWLCLHQDGLRIRKRPLRGDTVPSHLDPILYKPRPSGSALQASPTAPPPPWTIA